MDVIVTYSKIQLEQTVEYIAKYNKRFKNRKDYIKDSIMNTIISLVKEPDLTFMGTMGYIVTAEREFESIGNDENSCHIEIFVDPSLNINSEVRWTEPLHKEIISFPREKLWEK